MDHSGSQDAPKPEALASLRSYLADSIPPLIFGESAEDLLRLPLRTIAAEILGWVAAQSHIGDAVTTSDYLFHAVKKLHLMGELELLPRDRVKAFIRGLKPFLLQSCPEHERAALATSLDNVEHSEGTSAAPVGVVHRGGGPGLAGVAHAGGSAVLSDRRVGLLLHRLESALQAQPVAVPGQLGGATGPLVAGILSEAASLAQSPAELESSLGQLQRYGVPAVEEGIVRLLGRSLPDWAPPPPSDAAQQPPQNAVRAMRRIIGMAGDRQEKYKRFGELVNTAVDEFNAGSLGRAVTLLDLASRMIDEEEVEPTIVTAVRDKAHRAIDEKQLRQCAENEDSHYLLRRVIGFFPQLQPEEVFQELDTEENRDRRRLLLQLLAAQGETARAAALEALRGVLSGDRSYAWYLQRNMVYLLRTIPRLEESPIEPEIDVLVNTSELDNPLPLIRESLATLGQLEHDRVVKTLLARVSELEDALLGKRLVPHGQEEVESLLDTALTMLARTGSSEARRSLVAHGLRREPQLGNTMARLARLGGQDLSQDGTVVKRLVQALKEELPTKVLGLAVGGRRRAENSERLVEALSGTDTPLVRQIFADIGKRYSGDPLGATAARALERMGAVASAEEAVPTSTAALAGDLGLFGLPSLLQNLSDSQVTGILTVLDASGGTAAEIRLDGGLIRSVRAGQLGGEPAIYQMLERPILGRFVFVDGEDDSDINMEKNAPKPIQPLLFEGIRRYDEFMRAAALAPDTARFAATDRKPTRASDEPNEDLLTSVWYKAAGGASPVECEAEFPVDSYRIRRLFEHWISEGSLVPRAEQSAEPAGP